MALLHIILAHLLGDFVLQPKSVLEKKYKSWVGTLQHSLIISTVVALVLMPYWQYPYTWITVLVVGGSHFLQDMSKVHYIKTVTKKDKIVPYLLDQFLHISVIFFMGLKFSNLTPSPLPYWFIQIYFSPIVATILIGFLLSTVFLDITLYQFKQTSYKKPNYQRNYRRMGYSALIFGFLFAMAIQPFA